MMELIGNSEKCSQAVLWALGKGKLYLVCKTYTGFYD